MKRPVAIVLIAVGAMTFLLGSVLHVKAVSRESELVANFDSSDLARYKLAPSEEEDYAKSYAEHLRIASERERFSKQSRLAPFFCYGVSALAILMGIFAFALPSTPMLSARVPTADQRALGIIPDVEAEEFDLRNYAWLIVCGLPLLFLLAMFLMAMMR